MKQVNPKYILRTYIAEIIMRNPFDEHPAFEHYAGHPPEWAQSIEVSCSS